MIVKCLYNRGEDLRFFEYSNIEDKNVIGRFGASGHTVFGGVDVGTEYLVMGIIIFKDYQGYLIDDEGLISVYPCELFKITEDRIQNHNWHFRLIEKDENIYPYIQAIFGYPELCKNKKAYEDLIVEMDEDAKQIYLERKKEIKDRYSNNNF